MDTIVIISMFISAFLHAFWNYLLKRSNEPSLFIALSKILEAIIFIGPFLYIQQEHPLMLEHFGLIAGAALLVLASYIFLALTYRFLDMSIAYPVSRSSTLFLPFIAWFVLGESLSLIGIIAVFSIAFGVVLISLSSISSLKNLSSSSFKRLTKGAVLALAVAFISALQTIWSKIALLDIHPFVFFYSYTFLVAAGYVVYLYFHHSAQAIRNQLADNFPSISCVAVLNTASYGLFLYALSMANAAYVGSLRQLSLVIALMLGYWLMKETLGRNKILGTTIVITGTLLITFAG